MRLRVDYRVSICWVPFLRLRHAVVRRTVDPLCALGDGCTSSISVERFRSIRVFVVGPLTYGSTCRSRLEAMQHIFGEIGSLDTSPLVRCSRFLEHFATNHFFCGPSVRQLNETLRKQAEAFHPDIVWIDKGLHFWPDTLRRIQKNVRTFLVHYSPDNQMAPAFQSRHYLKSVSLYDVHITTKPCNVKWLRQCGARRVELAEKGFDPKIHRPMKLTSAEMELYGCDISFVGRWELSREETLFWLWKQGYRIKVWGNNWRLAKRRKHSLFAQARFLLGEDYARAICGSKVNLCLLSKWFGDKVTTRSVEIPACGGFLLAERTKEHQELFREGIEVEFYGTRKELAKKIAYYVQHEKEREAIARAGHVRCVAGYSNESCLREVLARIFS